MNIELDEFENEMLKLIANAIKNIKSEEEYIQRLNKKKCEDDGYFSTGDEENPYTIIPKVKETIECLKYTIRAYEVAIDTAKRISY